MTLLISPDNWSLTIWALMLIIAFLFGILFEYARLKSIFKDYEEDLERHKRFIADQQNMLKVYQRKFGNELKSR